MRLHQGPPAVLNSHARHFARRWCARVGKLDDSREATVPEPDIHRHNVTQVHPSCSVRTLFPAPVVPSETRVKEVLAFLRIPPPDTVSTYNYILCW